LNDPQLQSVDSDETPIPDEVGIFPLRNTVVYPYMPHQLTASRQRSLRVLDAAVESDNLIGIFAQRDVGVEEPSKKDLFKVGTIAKIHRLWRMPDGSVRLIVQGLARVAMEEIVQDAPTMRAKIRRLDDKGDVQSTAVEALSRTVLQQFRTIVELNPQLPDELQVVVMNIDHPGRLADFVAYDLELLLEEKQKVLELLEIGKRLEFLTGLLGREQEILEVGVRIQNQVQEKLGKSQREYYLREQLKHIQQELSGNDPLMAEVEELRGQLEKARLPAEAREAAEREMVRLEQMPVGAPEYSVARTYLDWLLTLPWEVSTDDQVDLKAAAQVLDDDHYGLEKVKERILEFLAVRRLRQETRGPILCFVGPPGVGKTSLGRSIARALGRKFVRISLGGVHDEAEIRGHRRTYIGALPGRIIQGLRKAGANNPVFMLDEIDKVGADFRGDPAAALLEVLDSEQNSTFSDHYLDVPYDLSKVLFITTANLMAPIPPALRDRMEEIPLPGYTPNEKREIANRHLWPRQQVEHGLKKGKVSLEAGVMGRLVGEYTREAGVRQLERQLGAICRKAARRFVEGRRVKMKVRKTDLEEFLGPVFFFPEVAGRRAEVGVVTGLAATAVGGEILFIEATRMRGSKKLILTGQLGEVMQESAQTALSYLQSRAADWAIDPDDFVDVDIHLHVPAGATPKEGPSAGVALAVGLTSLFTGKKVKGAVAMTGEITLRGRVLPVGGIRDKVLAAQRAGIRTVILPARNERDLEEVPQPIRAQMDFRLVEYFDEVYQIIFGKDEKTKSQTAQVKNGKKGTDQANGNGTSKPKTASKKVANRKKVGIVESRRKKQKNN
jgi:ATP-dependent Lon protease